MAKDIKYGLSFFARDRGAKRMMSGLMAQAKTLKRTLRTGIFGRGALPGMGIFKGGLFGMGTKVFGGILSAAKSVVSGVLSVFTGMVRGIVSIISGMVRTVTGLIGGILHQVKRIGLVAGGLFVAGMVFSIRQAAKLEDAMAEVATIATTWGADTLKQVTRQIQDLSVAVGRSSVELTAGLYQAVSAGATDAADAMKVLGIASKAAIAGASDIETVMKLLMGSVNAYGKSISDVGRMADIFFEGIRLGVFRFGELADAIGPVNAVAGNLGARLEHVVAAFATLTKADIKPARAGTALRMMLMQMVKPSDEAAKAAKQMGMPLGFKAFQQLGLTGMIKKLRQVTAGKPELISALFPDKRSMLAALTLVGKMFDTFMDISGQIEQSSGAMLKAFLIRLNTLSKRIGQLWQQIRKIAERIGEPFIEPLKTLTAQFTGMFNSIEAELVVFSTQMRDAALDVVEFFSGRTWRWDVIRDRARMALGELLLIGQTLADLFVIKTDGGLAIGPITAQILDAFTWLTGEIESLFQLLWTNVLADLSNRLGKLIQDLGVKWFGEVVEDRATRNALQESWRAITSPVKAMAGKAKLGAAGQLLDIGAGMQTPAKTEAEKEARREQIAADRARRWDAFMQNTTRNLEAIRKTGEKVPGPGWAREVFEATVPKAAPVAPAAAAAMPIVGVRGEEPPEIASLRRGIDRRLAVEQLLVRDIEAAEARGDDAASVAVLLQRLHVYMERTAELQQRLINAVSGVTDKIDALGQEQQRQEGQIGRLERRMSRMNTARA